MIPPSGSTIQGENSMSFNGVNAVAQQWMSATNVSEKEMFRGLLRTIKA